MKFIMNLNTFPLDQLNVLSGYLKHSHSNTAKEKQLIAIIVSILSSFKHLLTSFSQHKKRITEQVDGMNMKVARCLNIVKNYALNDPMDASSYSNDMIANSELFRTVYDPQLEISKNFGEKLKLQEDEIEAFKEVLKSLIEKCKANIQINKKTIAELNAKLGKFEDCKLTVKQLKHNKPIKKEHANLALSISISCADPLPAKEKYKTILDKILGNKIENRCAFILTDEPISNDELKSFGISLIGMSTKNMVRELEIENAYVSEGQWIIEIIKNNIKSLSKITINKTLLDITEIAKIMSSIRSSKLRLQELNLDENKLQGTDLNLLMKLLNGIKIKRFSIRKHQLDIHSIESFVKASKAFGSFEEIDIGEIKITEQKELEWRTNNISLTFHQVSS